MSLYQIPLLSSWRCDFQQWYFQQKIIMFLFFPCVYTHLDLAVSPSLELAKQCCKVIATANALSSSWLNRKWLYCFNIYVSIYCWSLTAFNTHSWFPSRPVLIRIFIRNGYWFLSSKFVASIDPFIWFLFHLMYCSHSFECPSVARMKHKSIFLSH